jgi:D-alanine-D-alanine ligase
MNDTDDLRDNLTVLIKNLSMQKDDIAITFVANVKQKTEGFQNYQDFSVDTEFFSVDEADQIIKSFRNFGLYVKVYTDEVAFMHDVITGSLVTSKKYHIVYSTAQKGTGPGRKALIPSFCNLNRINYTGSNAQVVSLCRHKYLYNKILLAHNLPVVKSWMYDIKSEWQQSEKPPLGMKVIIKPAYESSSIGVDEKSIMATNSYEELTAIVSKNALKFSQPMVIQEFIEGYEVEVPVLCFREKDTALIPVGLSYKNERNLGNSILTYDIIFNDNYEFYDYSEINQSYKCLTQIAIQATSILGIEGMGRVDFRITNDGRYFITDISTSPHIVKHSSFSFAITKLGFNSSDLPLLLIALGLEKYNNY